jgi:PRTRC genetic system protein C
MTISTLTATTFFHWRTDMAVQSIKRVIKFEDRKLQDVPGMSKEQLQAFYARIYPELATATVEEKVTTGGVEITFTTGYKSKG